MITLARLCLFSMIAIAPAALAAQTNSTAPKPAAPKPAAAKPAGTTTTRTTRMTTDPALLKPASLTAKAPDVYEVTLKTGKGDIVVQVTRAWAPLGADRFYNLVKHGFYNGASFFRIVPGFVVQFGLSGDPAVNRAWKNANLKDDPVTQSNKPGTLTFATAGPNTRTTQLFINLGNNAGLDGQGFAAFGQVTSGMDVVQKLYSGYGERPDQGAITSEGKAYVDKNFPNIDKIETATVTSPATTHTGAPAASAPKH
jgi:peptidyl-prolyl cis-trans isomerase A (cyclophilin A)